MQSMVTALYFFPRIVESNFNIFARPGLLCFSTKGFLKLPYALEEEFVEGGNFATLHQCSSKIVDKSNVNMDGMEESWRTL